MDQIGNIVTASLTVYALATGIFLISENRRPQATLAWMLAFFFAPGIGLLAYVLFGRPRKAFSRRNLLGEDLEGRVVSLLRPILGREDEAITKLSNNSGHRRLMTLVRRNSRSALTTRNKVEILQDAAAFYPRMMEDLKAARHSIYLQYFIWRTDGFGEQLKSILAEKARSGIQVRLLYDPLGSRADFNPGYVADMQAAGVQMVPTSPLYRIHTISYRNHRKITVVDGTIGYTGGMNIGDEHIDGGKYPSWRDTQIRLTGEAATLLQAVFMVDWQSATGEDLFSESALATENAVPAEGDIPVQILTSGPDSDWAAIRQLYFTMISTARRHVFLQSPYFVLDASIAEALKTAALSGIDVRVMLSAPGPSDILAGWAGNTYMAEVVAAGVRVYLYTKGYLHAKTISVDSEICSIGSANMDIRSFSINYELNAVLYSARLTTELERAFERDLAYCTAFDVAEYRRRNPLLRFRDSVARLLSPLM